MKIVLYHMLTAEVLLGSSVLIVDMFCLSQSELKKSLPRVRKCPYTCMTSGSFFISSAHVLQHVLFYWSLFDKILPQGYLFCDIQMYFISTNNDRRAIWYHSTCNQEEYFSWIWYQYFNSCSLISQLKKDGRLCLDMSSTCLWSTEQSDLFPHLCLWSQ